jgi:hypothetical protein
VYKNGKTYWTATGLPPSEHGAESKEMGAKAIFVFKIRRQTERTGKEKK